MNNLLDFLQSASNSAADTVAAPVDLLALLLRKAGVPVGTPVGGSDWMRQQGLRRDVPQSAASLAGETVGLLSPVVAAAKAPQIAKGLLQVEANAAKPRTLKPEAGAIVWHGSPHKFDKFDSSKIGTGEGAQAYGHGLYLAESPDVAKSYQAATSKDRFITRDGLFDPSQLEHLNVRATVRKGDLDKAIEIARTYGRPDADYPETAAKAARDLAKLEALKASGGITPNTGALYKVDLPDEKIARMLDWDKPLSQQPEAVREALYGVAPGRYMNDSAMGRRFISPPDAHMSGGAAYARTARLLDAGDAQASNALRQAGIPGIRYLDGGSRGAGAGTSNFVVFPGEEQYLRILERNGLLAP